MEIRVIKPVEEKTLSKEEREILFQRLSKELNIPYHLLEELGKLEDQYTKIEAEKLKPEIISILLRRIIEFRNVIPIVIDYHAPQKTSEDFNELFGLVKKGGLTTMKKLLKLKKNQKIRNPGINLNPAGYNLSTQLIKPQKCILVKDLEKYLTADNDLGLNYDTQKFYITNFGSESFIQVCGLVINNDQINDYYLDTIPGSLNDLAKLRTGQNNDDYQWNRWILPDKLFRTNLIYKNFNFVNSGLNSSPSGSYYILFDNEEKTQSFLSNLFDYLIYSQEYVLDNYNSQLINLARNGFSGTSGIFKWFKSGFDIFSDSNVVDLKENEISELKIPIFQKFIEKLDQENLGFGKFSFAWNNSIWFGFYKNKTILEKLYLISKDKISPEVKSKYESDIQKSIEILKKQEISRTLIRKKRLENIKKYSQEMLLRWIYIRKFGYEKFRIIFEKIKNWSSVDFNWNFGESILNLISPKEGEILLQDLQNFQQKNKIKEPWVNLVRKLLKSDNLRTRVKIFQELKNYLPKDPEKIQTDFIRDEQGNPIICPHIYKLEELEEKMLTDKISETEIRNQVLNYAGEFPIFGSFYCKICGEFIAESEDMESGQIFEGNQPHVWHNLDEVLKDYIWKQTNQIVRNQIEFKDLHSSKFINMFISNITAKLYDFINLIEKKLMKSKTSSMEEIEDKKKLFTVIYIYAILIKIITDNKEKITFQKIPGEPSVNKLMKYSLDQILYTQNIIISRLGDINENFIETSLSKAYQNVILVIDKTKLEQPPEFNLINSISLDPIFLINIQMLIIEKVRKNKLENNNIEKLLEIIGEYSNPIKLYPNYGVVNLKSLIEHLLKDEFIYKNLLWPELPQDLIDLFNKLTGMSLIISGNWEKRKKENFSPRQDNKLPKRIRNRNKDIYNILSRKKTKDNPNLKDIYNRLKGLKPSLRIEPNNQNNKSEISELKDYQFSELDKPDFEPVSNLEFPELSGFIGRDEPSDPNSIGNASVQDYQPKKLPKFSYKVRDLDSDLYLSGYFYESFNLLMEYVKSQIYLKPIFQVLITKDPENENINQITVNLTPEFSGFENKMQLLKIGEKLIQNLKKVWNIQPYNWFAIPTNIMFRWQTRGIMKFLSRVYGENFNKKFNQKLLPDSIQIKSDDKFHKHKWDIYVYVKLEKYSGNFINNYPESELHFFTGKELPGLIDKFYDYKLVDMVCQICLYSLNEVEKEIPDPLKIISQNQKIVNFYNFFENRCPESKTENIHEYNGEGVCKNCGFSKKIYQTKDLKYYNKYVAEFDKLQKTDKFMNNGIKLSLDVPELVKNILTIKIDAGKITKELENQLNNWKYNSNIINEIVVKTYDFIKKETENRTEFGEFKYKKNEYYNILANLGLSEKYDYEKIIEGIESPISNLSNSTSLQLSRINKLDIYIKEIIFTYTIFKNYKNLPNLPFYLKNLIDNASSQELENIQKLTNFRDIHLFDFKFNYFDTFNLIREYFYGNNLKISEFLMEYFCQLILLLLVNIEKNISKKISQGFITIIIIQIINIEKSTAKLKESKSAEVEAKQGTELIDEMVMQDHEQSRSYDGLVKGKSKYEYDFDFTDPGLDAGNYNSTI